MSAADASPDRPNVLIVMVDCLRADRCGLDDDGGLKCWPKLRRRGAAFTQMISSATNTPVCFAGLLTGQYSFAHGIRTIAGPRLNEGVATVATILKQRGYSTYAYLTGPMVASFGLDAGFDVYEHRPATETVYRPWGESLIDRFRRRQFTPAAFVLLHLFELHHPRALNGLQARPRSVLEYDLAWRQLDARLDELIQHVPANTIGVLTADHGERIGRRSDRTWWGHLSRKLRENLGRPRKPDHWKGHGFHVFDELVRIPAVITGPGLRQGAVVRDQVRQIDLFPTLLDLLGCEAPESTHGRSLVPAMRGQRLPEEPAYVESGRDDPPRHWHGLRTEKWKYVEHPRSGRNVDLCPTLFDLAADPQERRNVIRRNVDVALRLRHELDEVLRRHAAPAASGGREMSQKEQQVLEEQLRALGYI